MNNARVSQIWAEADQPVQDMGDAWNDYVSIEHDIQNATQKQDRPTPLLDAEEISTWQSNWAFKSLTDALDKLDQANRVHYDQTFSDTSTSLNLYFVLCLALFPLAGLLGMWGIWIHLKDF